MKMKLASIETIKNIRPHNGADSLEIADVLGWQIVVRKGIHQEGNKVVFIPIDTILPNTDWSAPFVNAKHPEKPIRVKMIKLRGEHSAGVVLPLSTFPRLADLEIGTDVGEDLGVTKYVKELPANLSGDSIGDFPTHLCSKTDEENGLSDLELVSQVISAPELTITQKIDGSSISLIVEKGQITQVCSRNLSKKDTPNSAFWTAAKKIKIVPGFTGVIQGELAGNGIQKNRLQLEDREIFVFQILKESGEYMTYQEMKGICNLEFGCKVVPLVAECSLTGLSAEDALKKLQQLADEQVYQGTKNPAEGIVVRPKLYHRSSSSRRPLGFKLINRNFKDD
jgi:RNA ligase (TIGR02306 family)